MKKLLALVLALVMTLGLATVSTNAKLSDFPDAKSINFDEAAAVMNAVGVFMGDQNGEFRPEAQLTRAEAAKIIAYMMLGNKAAESVVPSGAKFKDVAANAWYAKYIEYLASVSIMQGDEKGNANPDGALTAIDFAKMLLVSLGYDPKVEGLVGVDYRINTSKLANLVGLFNGNSDVVATNPVTREEAALYTFNAVKSPLVEYSSKGSTLTVNGAELNFGATNYKYVVSTVAKEQRISDQKLTNTGTTSDGGFTVEFGERYYPKLQLIKTDDDFGRPSNKWVYDNKDVGEYVQKDALLFETHGKLNGKTLFDLLGSERVYAGTLTYYVDGFEVVGDITQAKIAKTNTVNFNNPGLGVLTQVFEKDDDLVIVSINTYMAKANTDYSATTNDISIKIFNTGVGAAVPGDDASSTQDVFVKNQVSAEDIPGIVDFKKDTPLRVTIAYPHAGPRNTTTASVKTAVVPEFTTANTVTKFKTGDYLVTGGEQKDYAKKVFLAPDEKSGTPNPMSKYAENNALTDYTYNISYDEYGYVLGIEIYEGESKHVFLTGFDYTGTNLASGEATGYLIFSDGTTKTAKIDTTATNKNLSANGKGNGALKYADYPYFSGGPTGTETTLRGAQYNRWFTYTEKNGIYTLKPVQYWVTRLNTLDVAATVANQQINPASAKVDGVAVNSNTKTGLPIGYGNDSSTYITVEAGAVSNAAAGNLGIKKVTGIYTGIQKVDLKPFQTDDATQPDLGAGNGDFFAVVNGDNYIINAIVVGEDVGTTANYAYIVKTAQNEYVKDGNYYWEFQAIHEGELKTMTVKEKYDQAISTKIETAFGGGYAKTPNTYERPVVMTLKLDKDGFVVDADTVAEATTANDGVSSLGKVYGNTSNDNATTIKIGKDAKVWETYTTGTSVVSLSAIGRTLYTINGTVYNVGLTVAPSAPIYVIQQLVYAGGGNSKNPSVESYSDLAAAVASLGDADTTTAGNQFKGVVSAALNDNGTAKWIVIKSATPVTVGSTSSNPYTTTSSIAVTSKSGSFGAPKAGDELQVYWADATPATVSIRVNGTPVTSITVSQGLNGTGINVGKGTAYDALATSPSTGATLIGSGVGQ